MPLNSKQFEQLTGSPSHAGKNNPNSMTNRILAVIPTDGALNFKEICDHKELKNITTKQKRTLISNMVNKKNKAGKTKLEVKHDDESIAFYRKNAG